MALNPSGTIPAEPSSDRLELRVERCTGLPKIHLLKGFLVSMQVDGGKKQHTDTTSKNEAVWNKLKSNIL
ncbi:hypothetical protein FA95DRAFT_1608531 [Auriscalpium vulgare]|uniref:Uncharacterized protein n=1 Tax=Auriscalpium vulgare TaxID=40419 RepID=A0ACB8RKG9_9AGAM|nr:hypothetical protein FA95DRAFT_1608531 [Auriscalpium vulgare]